MENQTTKNQEVKAESKNSLAENLNVYHEVELPSLGAYYSDKDNIPEKISIRSMTTKEEKLLATFDRSESLSKQEGMFNNLISSCVKGDINMDSLTLGDRMFLFVKLRILTYGEEMQADLTCEECSHKMKSSIDLRGLPVFKYDKEDGMEPWEIMLPSLKRKAKVRLLRCKDERIVNRINLEHKERIRKNDDISTTLVLNRIIQSIEGMSDSEKQNFITSDRMNLSDSLFIKNFLGEKMPRIGMTVNGYCSSCNMDREFNVGMTNFFRPSGT